MLEGARAAGTAAAVASSLRAAVGDIRRELRRARYAAGQQRAVAAYLASTPTPKLHLGAGHHRLEGWLDTDRDASSGAVFLDVTRPFPLPAGTCTHVFAEHLVEHLPYGQATAMLRRCHRVLRPGGRIRLATPDLVTIMGLHAAVAPPRRAAPASVGAAHVSERYATWLADSYFTDRRGPAAVFAINKVMRGWGHRFLYDEATLRATLESCGFVAVQRHPFGHSDDPALRGLEGHGVADGNADLSAFETMAVEAVRR